MNLPRSLLRVRARARMSLAVYWSFLILSLLGVLGGMLFGQTPQNNTSKPVRKRPVDFGANQIPNQQNPVGGQSTPTPTATPTPTPTPPVLTLWADITDPVQGQLVNFSFRPPVPAKNALLFVFDFDDGQSGDPTDDVGGRNFSHRFRTAGSHQVTVTVRPPANFSSERAAYIQLPTIDPITINVSPLTLTVTPPGRSWTVDQPLTFTTQNLNDTSVRYRFVFDDNKDDPKKDEGIFDSSTKYVYRNEGDYQAHVEVQDAKTKKLLARSDSLTIVISRNMIAIDTIVVVVIVALFVAFGVVVSIVIYKWQPRPEIDTAPTPNQPPVQLPARPAPHPTVVLHSDQDASRDQKPALSLRLQVQLNSGIGDSQTQITIKEERLISWERQHV